jgi:hypothetical protein
MLGVITNIGVSFPLFCSTSLGELHEKWWIRGKLGIKIYAWPVRHLRALSSLDTHTQNKQNSNKNGDVQKTLIFRDFACHGYCLFV